MLYGEIINTSDIFDFLENYDIIKESIVLLDINMERLNNDFKQRFYSLPVNEYTDNVFINNNKIDAKPVADLIYTKCYYQLCNLLTGIKRYDFDKLMCSQSGVTSIEDVESGTRDHEENNTRKSQKTDKVTTYDSSDFVNDSLSDDVENGSSNNTENFESVHTTNKSHSLQNYDNVKRLVEIRQFYKDNLINTILYDAIKDVILSKIY